VNFTGLAQGAHTFSVTATDTAGNTDATPATATWTVDSIAPDTTITAQPTNPTNQTSATFSFISSEAGSTFMCTIDGGVNTVCTSPTTYTGLTAGSHTFTVAAHDAAGNVDASPASYTWVIDTVAPDTTITSQPTNPTTSTTATFTFTATEAGSTFQCQLDGGAYAACTTPATYTGLANGSHTFNVKATDAVGNTDATPATYTWTVNTSTSSCAMISVNGGTLAGCVHNANGTWTAVAAGTKWGQSFTVILPDGFAPLTGQTTVKFQIDDSNKNEQGIQLDVKLPAGTTKSVSVPRGNVGNNNDYACVNDEPGAHIEIGPGCSQSGAIKVAIPAAGNTETFATGKTISTNAAATSVTFTGLLNTALRVGLDADGDSVRDDNDDCPIVPGNSAHRGCDSQMNITYFERHRVGAGNHPNVSKELVANAPIRVFDRANGSCASNLGLTPSHYGQIFNTCPYVTQESTDANGMASVGLQANHPWIMIGYDADDNVYSKKNVNLNPGQTKNGKMHVIVRANGHAECADDDEDNGSILYTITPEEITWDNTVEPYPFVFESEGDWDVTVTVTPPAGFVSDVPSLSDVVNTDYKALQFNITDVGSCWECGMAMKVDLGHKGRKIQHVHQTETPMSEEWAVRKGLTDKEMKKRGIRTVKAGKGWKRGMASLNPVQHVAVAPVSAHVALSGGPRLALSAAKSVRLAEAIGAIADVKAARALAMR
jgi:hypothetical protein